MANLTRPIDLTRLHPGPWLRGRSRRAARTTRRGRRASLKALALRWPGSPQGLKAPLAPISADHMEASRRVVGDAG